MNKFGFKTNRMHRMIAAALCVAMLMGMIFQGTGRGERGAGAGSYKSC